MKTKIYISIIAIILTKVSYTQSFYGFCLNPSSQYTIFKADSTFQNLTYIHTFSDTTNGTYSSLGYYNDEGLEFLNGNLYGVCKTNSSNNLIYSIDTTTNVFSKKLYFNDTIKGTNIRSIKIMNNKIYCIATYSNTSKGGYSSNMVISEIDPVTYTYTIKLRTDNYDGNSAPLYGIYTLYSKLFKMPNGKYYIISASSNSGATQNLLELNFTNNTSTPIVTFSGTNGYNPYCSLNSINNKLYGTVAANNGGGIWEYDLTSNNYNLSPVSYTTNGFHNFAGKQIINNNSIYGATNEGGTSLDEGTIIKFDITTSTYSTLVIFNGLNGNHLTRGGGLTNGANNSFYGLAGGGNNNGIAFKYNMTTNVYTKLYNFASGYIPYNEMIYTGIVNNTATNIVDEFRNTKSTFIFPNPTQNSITIQTTKELMQAPSVKNILGQAVECKVIQTAANSYELNTSQLPTGIYFVLVDGVSYKIIKE
jgi:hypothetical protein